MDIYVGNLPYNCSDDDLRDMFVIYGEVDSARVVIDRDTGRSRGFGFVEMTNEPEANAAIQALNGADAQGRALTVNQARPRQPRGPRW